MCECMHVEENTHAAGTSRPDKDEHSRVGTEVEVAGIASDETGRERSGRVTAVALEHVDWISALHHTGTDTHRFAALCIMGSFAQVVADERTITYRIIWAARGVEVSWPIRKGNDARSDTDIKHSR